MLVHFHAVGGRPDPGGFQPQALHVRHAADPEEQLVAVDRPAVVQRQPLGVARSLDTPERRAEMQPDALPLEPPADHVAGFRVVLGQEAIAVADQVHLAAELAEGLSQLAPERPGADDRQPPGPLRQAEDRLVCQEPDIGQPFGFQSPGPRAGGDHSRPEPEPPAVHLHGVLGGEPRLPR